MMTLVMVMRTCVGYMVLNNMKGVTNIHDKRLVFLLLVFDFFYWSGYIICLWFIISAILKLKKVLNELTLEGINMSTACLHLSVILI